MSGFDGLGGAPTAKGTADRRAAVPPAQGTETVLVVEDERAVREMMRRVLSRCGYTVLTAADPQEALSIEGSFQQEIQLLVTDVVMPGMGGRELAARLSVSRPGVKVLYVSGYTENAIVHHGTLDPDVHFMQKPFALSALADKVRSVLDGTP